MNSFSEIDLYIEERIPNRISLSPYQNQTNPFSELPGFLMELGLNAEHTGIVAFQLKQIVKSAVFHFPENIFWDFDFLIYRITTNSMSTSSFDNSIQLYSDKILQIFEIFGAHSPIKFRYIHDFIYGYDWLKWMLEKRQASDNTDPFGVDFLNYIYQRGLELVELIRKNDANYPELDGVYRNPFLFSRTTEEEILLHKDLSSVGQIPIEAWNKHATPKSDKNYSVIRLERSREMGICKNNLPGSHKI
jgi:hypothetical protein